MKLPNDATVGRLHDLPTGLVLHRVHSDNYDGHGFNPCRGPEARFTHLKDAHGNCIPSLYAATTFDGAAYETIFRGRPSKFQVLPRQKIDDRVLSRLQLSETLELVPLFTPELSNWDLDPTGFFAAHVSVYPHCRALGFRCWRDNPTAQGLIWSSVRDSGAHAMLLFGDRIAPGVLRLLESRSVRTDSTALDDLEAAGNRAGWTIAK